jgi:G3E family GTPase
MPALGDTAVLINEFGEIGLDRELIERVDDNIVLLQSGCLCCTIRGELAEAIRGLDERRANGTIPPYRRLMIESTGLADPLPILTTITAEPVLRHHYRLGLVIATVDAVNGMGQLDRQPESRKQAAVADRLVLTKTDIATSRDAEVLVARLRRINPSAAILQAVDDTLDPEDLIGSDLFDLASKTREVRHWFEHEVEALAPSEHDEHRHAHGHHDHGAAHAQDTNRHGDDIRAFHLIFERPIDWTAFGLWLSLMLHRHGESILRVKGLLAIQGEAAPVAIHGVQQLVHPPIHLEAWPSHDRRSRIVVIGKGLDEGAVRRSFAAFVSMHDLESQPLND